VSVDEIARHAGVGIGTLYRTFANRHALLEALYADYLQALAGYAAELDDEDTWEALTSWLRRYVGCLATKEGIGLRADGNTRRGCGIRPRLPYGHSSCCRGVVGAQGAGVAHADIVLTDALNLVDGGRYRVGGNESMASRLLDVVLDGMRNPQHRRRGRRIAVSACVTRRYSGVRQLGSGSARMRTSTSWK
jgi:AcrR family transcriptional regulator